GLLPGSRQPQAGNGAVLETPLATPNVVAPSTQEALQNPAVPLISVPAPAGQGAAAPAPAAPATATPPAAATAPAATPAAATLAAPVTAVPAAAAGSNALVLNVREDAWIGVRPVSGGKPLIWREVKA